MEFIRIAKIKKRRNCRIIDYAVPGESKIKDKAKEKTGGQAKELQKI